MIEKLTDPNFTIPMVLIVAPILTVLVIWINEKVKNKRDREYKKQLGELFKPGRKLKCYRCKSKEFDVWELLFTLEVIKYSKGLMWCKEYLPSGTLINDGYEEDIMSLLSYMHKAVLTESVSGGEKIIKEWGTMI